jgi:hypothetical protein
MVHRAVLIRPLLVALTLSLGFGAVWGAAALWVGNIVRNWRYDREVYEELYIQFDGTPVIMTWKGGSREREVRTVDGVPVTQFQPVHASSLAAPRLGGFDGLSWHQRLYGFGIPDTPPQYWYFVHDGRQDGRGYFVGYDSEARTTLGYIGAQGFQRDLPAHAAHFAVDGRLLAGDYGQLRALSHMGAPVGSEPDVDSIVGQVTPPDVVAYLIAQDEVVEVNLTKRLVKPFFKESNLIAVGFTSRLMIPGAKAREAEKLDRALVARTTDRVIFFGEDGNRRRTLELPEEVRRRPFTVYDAPDGQALVIVAGRGEPGERIDEIYWLNADPARRTSRTVSLRRGEAPPDPHVQWLGYAAAAPSPLGLTASAALITPREQVGWGQAPDYPTAAARTLGDAWPALALTYLVSAALALVSWRWHRRHGGHSALVWSAFVLLLGVPGLVGYLCHRRWPTVVPCPACAQPAPRDREACVQCQATFPAPARRGTEVFG